MGLAGQEGMQAVQNSDYVLAQFCFLRRLLLVHGRWSYTRVCKFLRYFIYKTLASMMVQIWFTFYSGFTAQVRWRELPSWGGGAGGGWALGLPCPSHSLQEGSRQAHTRVITGQSCLKSQSSTDFYLAAFIEVEIPDEGKGWFHAQLSAKPFQGYLANLSFGARAGQVLQIYILQGETMRA